MPSHVRTDVEWIKTSLRELTHAEWKTLTVLAAYRNGNTNEAWPSVGNIARIGGLSKRCVGHCVKSLEKKGMLALETRCGRVTIYRFTGALSAPVVAHSVRGSDALSARPTHALSAPELSEPSELPEGTTTVLAAAKELVRISGKTWTLKNEISLGTWIADYGPDSVRDAIKTAMADPKQHDDPMRYVHGILKSRRTEAKKVAFNDLDARMAREAALDERDSKRRAKARERSTTKGGQ